MKRVKTQIEELRVELRYWQGRARLDARSLWSTIAKVKEIAALMRALQKKGKK